MSFRPAFGGLLQRSTIWAYKSCTITSGYFEPGPPKSLAASWFTRTTSVLFRFVYDGGTGVVVRQMILPLAVKADLSRRYNCSRWCR